MSPERPRHTLVAHLHAQPAEARLAPGDFDAAVSRRIEAARRAGVAEGRASDRDRAALALDAACARLDKAREQAAADVARTAVDLAVEIARVLVRSEIDSGRLGLEAMVRDALSASGVGRGACVVHLHPLDAAALASVKFRAGTTLESDEAVARGDVHVSTPQGLLVREIHDALRSVRERLLSELNT